MKHPAQVLFAFVIGQGLQLVLHALSTTLFAAKQIQICGAIGALIALAFCVGMYLTAKEQSITNLSVTEVFSDEDQAD